MIEKLPSYFSMIAAVMVIIIGFLTNKESEEILIRLAYIIIIAYCFGFILRSYLRKNVFPEEKTEEIDIDIDSFLDDINTDASMEDADITSADTINLRENDYE